MSETARLAGTVVPAAVTAALIVSEVGWRKLPALFCSIASPSPACWAAASAFTPTYATQPGFALQVWTMPGMPWAISSPGAAGHVTVVDKPGPLCHWLLVADRKLVKRNVSPEESTRRTGMIVVAGRVTPELSALIAGSFHFLIAP